MLEQAAHEQLITDVPVTTNGGSYIGRGVNTSGGDFVGRDKIVQGAEVHVYVQPLSLPPLLPPPAPGRPPTTDFVGRTLELTYYVERLQNDHLVVMIGMAGVGKTALAALLAQHVTKAEKIFWHPFHEQEDASVLVWKLASFLALQGQAELWRMLQTVQQHGRQPPPLETLIDCLLPQVSRQGYLLCLDDLHWVDTDPLLVALVVRLLDAAAGGQVRLILLSRRTLRFMPTTEADLLVGLSLADTRQLLARRGLALSDELTAALHINTAGNAQLLLLAIDALRRAPQSAHLIEHLATTDNIERYLLNEVDSGLNDTERAVMSAVAVLLGYPASRTALEVLLEGVNLRRPLRALCDRHLLVVSGEGSDQCYSQHAIVQAFYYDLLAANQRRLLHAQAAGYYVRENKLIEAATHWYHAGDIERAAITLHANLHVLINTGKSQALYKLQAQLRKDELSATTWARLKIAAGRAALLVEDIPTALAEFEKALQTSDLYDQVQALYYRAKAYKTVSYAESLSHFNWGIARLQALSTDARYAELLVDLYIGKAWLYLEETQNFDQAEANLTQAQTLLATPDFGRSCDLHNAWARLCVKQSNTAKELEHRQAAWQAACTSQDRERMIMTAHNLGQAYIWAGELEAGFDYLQKALAQANEIGDLSAQGKCHQSLGAGYFFQGQYQTALQHDRLAYAACQKSGNQDRLGEVCYDLAEVSLALNDQAQGRDYFSQAMVIAEQLGAQDLQAALTQLAGQFPGLLRKEHEPCG